MLARTLAAFVSLCSAVAFAQYLDAGTGLRQEVVPLIQPGGGEPNLTNPTDLRFLPDGRMLITEKCLNTSANGIDNDTARLLIRQATGQLNVVYKFAVDGRSEKGLLGVEVDPAYNTTKRIFLYYSEPTGDGGTDLDRHRVISMTMMANDTLDPLSYKILVRGLRGPANHDGGGLAIGPDGKLYIGVGDTGCNTTCCPAAKMGASPI